MRTSRPIFAALALTLVTAMAVSLSMAGGTTPPLAPVDDLENAPLAHMVYFSLKEDSEESRQKLIDGCKAHLTDHEGTLGFAVGTIAKEFDREVNDQDFEIALHLVFENKAAHDTYQDHPRHQKFIDDYSDLWANVRVFDSYLVTMSGSGVR